MNDIYLWDGSGEPDLEIQKLEDALARFRHQGQAPEFPEFTANEPQRLWSGVFPSLWLPRLRLAPAIFFLLLIASFGILRWSQKSYMAAAPGWDIERVAGMPRVESNSLRITPQAARLGLGQTLITDSRSQATLSLAAIGTVDVEPNSRLRLVAGSKGHTQLALDHGTIHAFIWAAPGEFTVDTPSALAVDLGCAYTLQVDDSGAGVLRTTIGWVGFKFNGREAFIPAGAACATRPKVGPGTPYFEDASETFRDALSQFDFATLTPETRGAELSKILAEARPRDAFSLWHLLARVDPSQRSRVYERLATLVPPPSGVTKDGILRLDQKMLDLWWNRLGLGDVSLWRTWERSWSPAKT
ncbi:MAG: FecR domain-containing protein [Candidatus Acidiferrum sp.]